MCMLKTTPYRRRLGWIKWKINYYLVPWCLQSAGFLIAESTGMTSWEHGVLSAIDPEIKLGLQTRQLTGSAVFRWLQRACSSVCWCVPARRINPWRLQGAQTLDSARAVVDLSSSPFVWIGREKVQSLLRWAGLFSQNTGSKALLPPIISSVFFYHYHSDYMT